MTELSGHLQAALDAVRVRSSRLRPDGALEALAQALRERFAGRPELRLSQGGGRLWVDGAPEPEDQGAARGFCLEMTRLGLVEIILEPEVTVRELQELMLVLNETGASLGAQGGPLVAFRGRGVQRIRLQGRSEAWSGAGAPAAARRPAQRPAPTLEMYLETALGRGFQSQDPKEWIELMRRTLEGNLLEAFFRAAEQVFLTLSGGDAAGRAKALETLRLLAYDRMALAMPAPVLVRVVQSLVPFLGPEQPEATRESTRSILAHLLGCLGVAGEWETLWTFLDQLRTGRPDPLLASASLARPLVQAHAREGAPRDEIMRFFRQAGDEGAMALTALLGEEPGRQQRSQILALLRELAPGSLPALRAALAGGPWYLVRNVLILLGELEDHQAFDAIGPCLVHPDLRVRRAAVRAFWKTGGAWAEIGLLDLLQRSDPETQGEVLAGLARIQSAAAVPVVGALASTAPEPLRIKALEALGQIGQASAVPALWAHLKRSGLFSRKVAPPEVRLAAAKALAELRAPEARVALERALASEPRGPFREVLRDLARRGAPTS